MLLLPDETLWSLIKQLRAKSWPILDFQGSFYCINPGSNRTRDGVQQGVMGRWSRVVKRGKVPRKKTGEGNFWKGTNV